MVTMAYRQWEHEGKPFELAQPVRELAAWARGNGVQVLGTIGNQAHLTADRPLDHTPFASTQWPVALFEPIVCAIDLKNITRDGVSLGEAIEAQMRAGLLPWLKYMNHAHQHIDSRDVDGDGKRFEVEDSSDKHVHLSIRTDWVKKTIGAFAPWGNEDDMPSVNDLLNVGQIELTEQTAKRLAAAAEGDKRSVGNLLQNTLIQAADARTLAEAVAKRLIAVEAQAQANGGQLSNIARSLEQISSVLGSGRWSPAEEKSDEPAKPTPATVAKKATPAGVKK